MPSIIKEGSRRYVMLAFAAALFGAGAAAPAPAAARAQNAAMGCDPSFETCDVRYEYYSDRTKTSQVGYAEDPCEGSYTLVWGQETSYVTVLSLYCPY